MEKSRIFEKRGREYQLHELFYLLRDIKKEKINSCFYLLHVCIYRYMSGKIDLTIAKNTFCGAKNSQHKFALSSTVGYKSISFVYVNQRLYYFGFNSVMIYYLKFFFWGGGREGWKLFRHNICFLMII